MRRFTHGIIAINPIPDENDTVRILHFIGLWQAPTEEAFLDFEEEIKTDPEFGLVDIADKIQVLMASQEIVEMYNDSFDLPEN
jgi:hypothetical protein